MDRFPKVFPTATLFAKELFAMAYGRWQFGLKFIVLLTTASCVVLGIGAWIGYSVAAEILASLCVIALIAAIPVTIFGALMLILIYAPTDPFARRAEKDAPPHQFDARDY